MNQVLNERELLCKNATEEWEKACGMLCDSVANHDRLDQIERRLISAFMRLGRACLQDVLEASGDGDVGETVSKGDVTLKRSQQKHRRRYRSIFGPLPIERFVYAVGAKQKVQVAPLDEKVGLPADETSYVLGVG